MQHRPRRLLTRRELAVAATVTGAYALVPPAFARIVEPRATEGPGRFLDGVASGEPSHDAVTFWSRLRTDRPVSGARLVVAEDEGLTRTVATAVVPTSRSVDGALKTRIDGLRPGRHYWYVWQSADDVSPVGRTKTAPAPGSREPVRIGYSSCQNYPVGFFNAHRDAAQTDLDLYAFLGDYTYEYDASDPDVPSRGDVASVDLASYRGKLQLYRSDPDLRELHRLHPVVHIWDDHEVADNYSDNDPAPSAQQRSAGYRASFEWLPRMATAGERFRTYRTLRYGDTAEILLLDQRQYRTGDGDGQPRSMLGARQHAWLKERLEASTARWKLVANQAMFSPLAVLNVIPVNTDQWDGYPAERADLTDLIATKGIENVVFLTGDIHLYIASHVRRGVQNVATEYVGGSVTSTGVPKELDGIAGAVIIANNLHYEFFGDSAHGWALAEVRDDMLVTTYREAPLAAPGGKASDLAKFVELAGSAEIQQVAGRSLVTRGTGIVGEDPAARRPLAGSDLATRQSRFARRVRRDRERRAL